MKATVYKAFEGAIAVEYSDNPGFYAIMSDVFLLFEVFDKVLFEAKDRFDYSTYQETFQGQESPEVLKEFDYAQEDNND